MLAGYHILTKFYTGLADWWPRWWTSCMARHKPLARTLGHSIIPEYLWTQMFMFSNVLKYQKTRFIFFRLIRCLACTITKPGQTRRETDGRRDTSPISVLNSIWSVFNATRDQWLHKLKGICWNFEANYPGGAAVLLLRKIVSKSQWVVISLQEVLKVSVCWPELGSRIELVIVLVCIL